MWKKRKSKKVESKKKGLAGIDVLFPGFLKSSTDLRSYQDVEVPEKAEGVGWENVVENDGSGNYTSVYVVYFTDKDGTDEFGDIEYFDDAEEASEFADNFADLKGLRRSGQYDDSYISKPEEADRIVLDEDFDGNAIVYFGDESGGQLTSIVRSENELSKRQAANFARTYADKYRLPLYDLL